MQIYLTKCKYEGRNIITVSVNKPYQKEVIDNMNNLGYEFPDTVESMVIVVDDDWKGFVGGLFV